MIWLTAALAATLLLSPLFDRLMQPGLRWRDRLAAAWVIQLGLVGLAFGLLLVLTRRPGFAAALTLAGQLVLVLVNNAKFKALREPFVFSDFGLYSQALAHPRLYLPFLGLAPAIAGVLAFIVALYLGLVLEASLVDQMGLANFAIAAGSVMLLAVIAVTVGSRLVPPPSLSACNDLQHFGLLASLWLYRLAEYRHDPGNPSHLARQRPRLRVAKLPEKKLPHFLVVQSESFFDVRRLYPQIRPEILGHFDAACRSAAAHGPLRVPAWGANTMRTEFAFLSGLDEEMLGVHRFNPFRRFAHHRGQTLATALRDAGYDTVCLHPHPASFFSRDRVYPQLGFDSFIDIRAFPDAEKVGPYVSDAAVAARVRELLAAAEAPTLLFVITMENHGPLHLEPVAAGDIERLYRTPPPCSFDDLSVYLRHLANADHMLGELVALCERNDRETVLCFYGDHVPSMPHVYAAQDFHDGRSDYLIWRSGSVTDQVEELAADQLGRRLLQVAGMLDRD
ncbi:MAG: sulfatase-like hydrolase/transferase [Thiobacillus sp.]|nr:sulfatase-like hydrolase/transferase [Thiobacillus sp.]